MSGKMRSVGPAQWLGCLLLMLALYGSTVNAHGKHAAKVKQAGVFYLKPSCVPKYATELLLPPPMPRNTAPNTLPMGRCSYAFEHPPHCSPDYPHREGSYNRLNSCSDQYPDDNGYPGYDNGYPGYDNGYPGYDNGYPGHDDAYPGRDSYPGRDAYPGHGAYPGRDAYPDRDDAYPGYAELQAAPADRTLLAEGVAQPASGSVPASAEAQQAVEVAAALKYKSKDKHAGEYRKPAHHEGPGEHYSRDHDKHAPKPYDRPGHHHGPGPYDHPDHEPHGRHYSNKPYYDGSYDQPYYRSHDWHGYHDGKEWVNPGPHARYDPSYGGYGDQPAYPDQDYHTPSACDVNGFRDFQISVKQINQKSVFPATLNLTDVTCPSALPTTPVFAYGPTNRPDSSYNWPAFTIESTRYQPNRIRWANELVNSDGTYRTHLFPSAVDQTLHWANPQKIGGSMIDESPCMACSANGINCGGACALAANAASYTGPVPIVTHVHGMENVRDYSDGYAEAWFLPNANNLGTAAKVGTWYNTFKDKYELDTRQPYTGPGSATYIYPNTQRPSAAWYHDHTVGLTRLNVYAGLAGFNFVRNFFPLNRPELPGIPYPPPAGGNQVSSTIRELPLAIQDRLFLKDGSLWYPEVEQNGGTYLPSPFGNPPKWLVEFPLDSSPGAFPIMMTVNGRVWPQRTLVPDTYRLRLLNGCNSRTLRINFAMGSTSSANADFNIAQTATYTNLPFWVIGGEAGFFPQIQGPFYNLTMGPAERFDVIIDLSEMTPAQYVWMYNTGPDAVYPMQMEPSLQTSQLLRFQFSPTASGTGFTPQRQARLNKALAKEAPKPLPKPTRPARQLALIEENGVGSTGVKAVLLGRATVGNNPNQGIPEFWAEPVTIDTPTNTVEDWDIINLTQDAHPIHLHEVFFETISRTAITVVPGSTNFTDQPTPVPSPDLDPMLFLDCPTCVSGSPNTKCPAQRDVTLMLPSTRTRIRIRTGKKPGLFVWHCHLLEHEDNEMMRPWCVGQPKYKDPKNLARDFCPGDNEG